MFGWKQRSQLELAIDSAIRDLNRHEIGTTEYNKRMEALIKLHRMKVEETRDPVSSDTLANVVGNLLAVLMIVKHESVNNIASKALLFVTRLR
jgi:hypothetical protein